MFKETTYEELTALAPADRMIAAVRCEATSLHDRGSRSERVLLTTRLLAGADKIAFDAPLRFTRYTQGDALMKVGDVYLIAAYRGEWLPAWNLVEHVALDAANAAAAIGAAQAELAARGKR